MAGPVSLANWVCLCVCVCRDRRKSQTQKKRIKRKSPWREEAREGIWKAEGGGRSEGEMWACLIQRTVVVTCPSAQSIGRTRKKEEDREYGGSEDRNTATPSTIISTPSREPEASVMAGNLLRRQAMERKTYKKKGTATWFSPLFLRIFSHCVLTPKTADFSRLFFKNQTHAPHTQTYPHVYSLCKRTHQQAWAHAPSSLSPHVYVSHATSVASLGCLEWCCV